MVHEVDEGTQYQSADEIIVYKITTTNWVSDPTSPSVAVYQMSTDTDVTSTVMPINSPSVSGDEIRLSPLKSLTVGETYRVEVKFVVDDNTYECYFKVKCDW